MKSGKTRVSLIFLGLLIGGCVDSHKKELPKQKADSLMNEIGNGNALKEFPERQFAQKDINYLLQYLSDSCRFAHLSVASCYAPLCLWRPATVFALRLSEAS